MHSVTTTWPGLRVLFVTFHLPGPSEAGAARSWEQLQLMRELGWDVTAIVASAHYLTGRIDHPVRGLWRTDVEDGVTVVRTWSPRDFRRSIPRRVACLLSYAAITFLAGLMQPRFDVVFCGTEIPVNTPGAYLLARRHRARLVLDERDLHPDTAIAIGMSVPRPVVVCLSAWYCWVRERASSVITVSPGLKTLLADRGASHDRIFVIPNYIPSEEETVAADAVVPKRSGRFTVLYAGGMGRGTRIDVCLDAAALLQKRGYDSIRFVFLGAGERVAEYQARGAEQGLTNVEFRGAVPRAELPDIMASVDVGVHSFPPHPYFRMALSSKIFEYMSHGKPVIFAGEGDIADVLRESGGGITVPPEDAESMAAAIGELYENQDRCAQMGACAARYVRERFNRPRVREQMAQAFGAA